MAGEKIFSVCGMCTVRCPIQVEVQDGKIKFIQGTSAIAGGLCARGSAGLALIEDDERPQYPMIRAGARGEGKWQKVSWDEALDYTAKRLQDVMAKYGPRTVLFSDRGGPFLDLHQAFMRGLGSPNWCNHDASCARNVMHGAMSVFGFGRKGVGYDLKNAKHVVLQTRNMFEAINVKECNDLMSALSDGCKLTVIDIRATKTAAHASRFFLVRPGTDYAFNLAVIHQIIKDKLYDAEFVDLWIKDFDALRDFVQPYTPQWAAQETGVDADELVAFTRELAEAKPAIIWHPGWMNARYRDSFYMSRTAYIINSLMGSIGAKGGLPIANTPGDVGRQGLKKLVDLVPKPKEQRADGVGWRHPHLDPGPGLLHLAFQAIATEDPYPVKAYIAYRHDPMMAMPEPDRQKKIFENLDFLVSVTFSWSDTAWLADVILPLSPYLERESILAAKNGVKPSFFVRQRAVQPRFDTRADWEILCGLAKRLGIEPLAFEAIEDIWNYQLQDTGVTIADFKATGTVSLSDQPYYRPRTELKFTTPSGKIEIINSRWENAGQKCLKPYESPQKPEPGTFRITFGRCPVHTQGHTVNNKLLHEQMPENVLWINKDSAGKLGIQDGDMVEIGGNGHKGQMKAKVTEFIHPEAVFMVHGFGHTLPVESRAFGKGVADNIFMPKGLDKWDPAGGALALQEHFVSVRKIG